MGRRTTTFSAGSHLPAGSLNEQQDRAHTLDRASATSASAPTDTQGADWIAYQSPNTTGVPAGQVATVDLFATAARDWRERFVMATARFVATAARRWGGADEHVGNDPASTNIRTAVGVTGPGALGAASAPVANGTPPVVTTNSCPIPLDVRSDGTVWLFADPADGSLKLYNATTTPLHFDLVVMATGRAPDASAPPPDLVPTLTEILWLTPSVASSRPSSPGALIAIHRATDTGAVTLWDGGAWRVLWSASPLTTRGDLYVRGASADTRLALGAALKVLGSNGTDPVYNDLDAFFPLTEGSTSDAAWTTIASIPIADMQMLGLSITVMARKDDASAGGFWVGSCAYRRYGGTVNEVAPFTQLVDAAEAVGLDVRTQAGATTVNLQVKGIAANDYTWRATYARLYIGG